VKIEQTGFDTPAVLPSSAAAHAGNDTQRLERFEPLVQYMAAQQRHERTALAITEANRRAASNQRITDEELSRAGERIRKQRERQSPAPPPADSAHAEAPRFRSASPHAGRPQSAAAWPDHPGRPVSSLASELQTPGIEAEERGSAGDANAASALRGAHEQRAGSNPGGGARGTGAPPVAAVAQSSVGAGPARPEMSALVAGATSSVDLRPGGQPPAAPVISAGADMDGSAPGAQRGALRHFAGARPAAGHDPAARAARPVVFDVLQVLRAHHHQGRSVVRLQLRPADWGRLTVHLQLERQSITVRIATETEAVRDLLQANARLLAEALQEQGLNLQRLQIDWQDPQVPASGHPGGETGGSPRGEEGDGEETSAVADAPGRDHDNFETAAALPLLEAERAAGLYIPGRVDVTA
jgi:hypothetical protein